MNFFKAFYITGATSVAVTILAFFNNVFLTRYLGPEGRGQYSIIVNLVLVLALILGEGLRRSNIIIVGKNKEKYAEVAKKSFLAFLVLIALAWLAVYITPPDFIEKFNISPELVYIGLFATAFLILWRSVQSVFLGLQKFSTYNIAQLIYTSLLLVINLIALYVFNFSLSEILLNFIIVASVVTIYEYIEVHRYSKFSSESSNNEQAKSYILRATITSISGFLLLKGDIFLVNYYLDNSMTGYYSISKVITDVFQKLPLVLGPIIIARSARMDEKKEAVKVSQISRVLVLLNIAAILFTVIFGKAIVTLLFTSEFELSYNLLLFILPSLLIFSSGHVINAFLMGQGFPNFVLINNFVFAAINIGLNIYLAPLYGIESIAINCAVCYSLWAASFIIYFCVKYKIPLKNMFIITIEDFLFLKRKIFA